MHVNKNAIQVNALEKKEDHFQMSPSLIFFFSISVKAKYATNSISCTVAFLITG